MTINRRSGCSRDAKTSNSKISRVFPELEITSIRSFSCRTPKSPCWASLGCRKTEGIPVEQKVVAIFMAICPAFPIPLVTNFPFLRCTCSTINEIAFSKASDIGIFNIAFASRCKID